MAFLLNSVVPWGRNFNEYKTMFRLTDADMKKSIAGFGDGPASFNYEATMQGCFVTSFDVIYRFTKGELEQRIEEVRSAVMQQMKENKDNYVWTNIHNLAELEEIRMSAMSLFLMDYEKGKSENRYVFHELPNRLPYNDNTFDIGLSSHFLLMYTSLGYDFHIRTIDEMLRVCREIRIFPLVDLDGNNTELINSVIDYCKTKYCVTTVKTNYEFQKAADKLLVIKKL